MVPVELLTKMLHGNSFESLELLFMKIFPLAIAKLATCHNELLPRAQVALAKVARSRGTDRRVWQRACDYLGILNEPAISLSILGPSWVVQRPGTVNWSEGSTKIVSHVPFIFYLNKKVHPFMTTLSQIFFPVNKGSFLLCSLSPSPRFVEATINLIGYSSRMEYGQSLRASTSYKSRQQALVKSNEAQMRAEGVGLSSYLGGGDVRFGWQNSGVGCCSGYGRSNGHLALKNISGALIHQNGNLMKRWKRSPWSPCSITQYCSLDPQVSWSGRVANQKAECNVVRMVTVEDHRLYRNLDEQWRTSF
ncbi:hypothetical protein HPP92_009190 [Vanilla planifolia]|uniref:Uncharacterized protein n=1 Tax=Vanilla planifolia TaxID=51239 RepID=A0A835RFD8_VANPL|nr:hypothetical protein HPP92_009190 [Vanilla planifolia]